MKKRFLLSLIVSISCSVNASDTPDKIKEMFTDKGVFIDEYTFNSKRVFLIDGREECCDLGAQVYDINGETYCRYIGIAGAWETKCTDFDKNAKFIKKHSPKNEGT